MADYYPLIARALESLSDKSPDTRRAVYDRARAALVDQLRSLRPALPEADITRERLALDDAIARIEAEHGGQPAKPAPRPASAPRPANAPRSGMEPRPAPARPEPTPRPAPPPPAAPSPSAAPPAAPRPAADRAAPQAPGASGLRPVPPPPPPPRAAPQPAPAAPVPPSGAAPSSVGPSPARIEPVAPMAGRTAGAAAAARAAIAPAPTPAAPPATPLRPPPRPPAEPVRAAAPPPPPAFEEYLPEAREVVETLEPPEGEPPLGAPAAEPPLRPRVQTRGPRVHADNRMRSIILIASVLTVVLLIAGLAVRWKVNPETDFRQQSAGSTDAQPAENQPKIAERVGGSPATPVAGPAQPPGRAVDVSVPQRAIFYEEDPADPQNPKATPGRVTWRLENVNPGQGLPLQAAVRAVVEVPDANLTLNVLIRRNLDPTLPASHTIELAFATRPGDEGRVARDVGLLQFKNEEAARGTPVAGLQVPVRENLFLIGLSNLNPNIERNLNLLLRQNWIDLPIRLASGQRAIVSFEKGPAGERVLNDAARQWQAAGP